MLNKILIFLLISTILYAVDTKKELVFTPLPIKKDIKTLEEFVPLFGYVEKLSGIKTQFSYEQNYADVIEKFKDGKIDIALLGPLPYMKLNQVYEFNEPLITLKQKNGKASYKCVLSKFKKDKVDFEKELKIALTQPLSTCGYYMTEKLLKKRYDINLKEQRYGYTMSHDNALLKVLEGEFQIAGVKEDIAQTFSTLGMEIIAKSESIFAFTLVVNTKTVSKKQIKTLQNLILSIPKSTYQRWKGMPSHGFLKADKSDYKHLKVDFDAIPSSGNINEK